MAVETTKLICTTCPVGCELTVTHDGTEVLEVEANQCKLGAEYARQEISAPRRMIITTVRVKGGSHPLVPVRSIEAVPKEMIFSVLKELRKVELEAPVEIHQVVLENALDTGVDMVTSRSLPAG